MVFSARKQNSRWLHGAKSLRKTQSCGDFLRISDKKHMSADICEYCNQLLQYLKLLFR